LRGFDTGGEHQDEARKHQRSAHADLLRSRSAPCRQRPLSMRGGAAGPGAKHRRSPVFQLSLTVRTGTRPYR
jgi:hypothetical protein